MRGRPRERGRQGLSFAEVGRGHGLLQLHEMDLAGSRQAELGCGGGGIGHGPGHGEAVGQDVAGGLVGD